MPAATPSALNPRRGGPSATRLVAYLLALLPLIYLVGMLLRFYVDVPIGDQWVFVSTLEKSYTGTLSFADLQAQHGEHRMLFPRLIMIALAHLTHWNTGYEIGVTVTLAVGLLLVLLYQVRLLQADTGWSRFVWHVPLFALLVLSLGQGENWFCGWQLQFPLGIGCVALGIALLGRPTWSLGRIVGAVAAGIVTTYSLGNGPLFWPIALALMACLPWPRRRKWASVLGLAAACVLLFWWYFHDYVQSANTPIFLPWHGPVRFLRYTLGYLGGPLSSKLPELFGLAGLGLLVGALWVLVRRRQVSLVALAPLLALAAYAVLSALGTAVTRLNYHDLVNCASSRYQAISQLLWIADSVLLLLLATPREGEGPRREWSSRRRAEAGVAVGLLVLLVLPLVRREVVWFPELRRQGAQRVFLRDLLLAPDEFLLHPPPELAAAIHRACIPRDATEMVAKRPFLIEHRLSLYRLALPTGKPPPPPSPLSGL